MTNLRTALVLSVLSIAAAACGKSSAGPAAVQCDAKAIDELAKDIDTANGIRRSMSEEIAEKPMAEAKAKITGKTYAFKGCEFRMQGSDQVSFGASGTEKYLVCRMKGREAGVKELRQAAMKLDLDKLKLDVRGKITLHGDKGFERLSLDDCTIAAHE